MTIKEYKDLVSKASNPDTLPQVLQDIITSIETDLTDKEALETKVSEQEETIKTLRDTNMKLFLSVTGSGAEEEEEEEELNLKHLVDNILTKE